MLGLHSVARLGARRCAWLALVAAMLGGAALAAPAGAYIYSSLSQGGSDGGGVITTAQLDGTNLQSLTDSTVEGTNGVAVDATHVYWTMGSTIARANVDGSGADTNFVNLGSQADGATSIAVDGGHIYWTSGTSIGRANLDGSGVTSSFISRGFATPSGIADDGSHLYWFESASGGAIERANLDGSNVTQIVSFQFGNQTAAVAVDAAHIYWTEPSAIGRVDLDGSNENDNLIALPQYSNPSAIVAYGGQIYWTVTSGIGRASTDGSGVNPSFVAGADPNQGFAGLAIDALGADPSATRVSCNPTVIPVFHNETGPEWLPTTCTASVRDPSGQPRPVRGGTVAFTVRSASLNDGGDLFPCSIASGGSSCSIMYTPNATPPTGAGPATVMAAYSGESAHLPSSGQTTITLSLGKSAAAGHASPCASLRGVAAKRCQINRRHTADLARCRKLKRSKRAACVKQANGRYRHALSLLKKPATHKKPAKHKKAPTRKKPTH